MSYKQEEDEYILGEVLALAFLVAIVTISLLAIIQWTL